MRLIDADHFIKTLDTVVQRHESVLWQKVAETMKFMIEGEAEFFPVAPQRKGKWISRDGREDCYECSECHAVIESDEV